MLNANPYQQYRQNSVMTAPPEELTLMLYEGLVKFIKRAKMMMMQGKIQETHDAIMRAEDIVSELNVSLNMEYELSKSLRALYDFVQERLIQANIKKDAAGLDDVLGLAEEFRDAWKEAMPNMR